MNQYNCETCEDETCDIKSGRCTKEYTKIHKAFTVKYGCASHTSHTIAPAPSTNLELVGHLAGPNDTGGQYVQPLFVEKTPAPEEKP